MRQARPTVGRFEIDEGQAAVDDAARPDARGGRGRRQGRVDIVSVPPELVCDPRYRRGAKPLHDARG